MAAVDLRAELEAGGEDDLNTEWAEKAWMQTVADIEKITGWRLDREKTPSIDAVINKISPNDSVSDSTKQKAKNVFRQTLTVLQRTGAIVAPAAGMVFGPSQQCFNAVNFVIIAVQDYQNVYEQIAALMERISVFLERFQIRLKQNAEVLQTPGGTQSDLPLMAPTFRVLEHFVTILGRVQKLTHGWKNKLKLFAKVGAFGEDGGIREALAKLETKVQDVTHTQIAVIGRDLSGMAKDMRDFKRWSDQVLDYAQRSDAALGQLKTAKDKEDERREMEKVRRKLGLDDKEPWKRHFEKLSEERIKDTGRWILESPSFRLWADFNEPRSSVLALRGESNVGKSFLCSTVIDYMLDRYPPKKEMPRASVGYYFIRREATERKDSLNDALRAVIWQLAQSDAGYSKLVQRQCDRETDFPTTNDLWTTLITNLAKITNATFFLILDGVDELSEDASRWIANNLVIEMLDSEGSGGLRLRILLSGRSKAIDSLQEKCGHRMNVIELGQKGLPETDVPHVGDLEKFVLQRNEWTDILSDKELAIDNEDFTRDFPGRLASSVEGDYGILKDKLRQMEGCKDMEELEDILQVTVKTSFDGTNDRMEAFVATLNSNEIAELNEILAWISVTGLGASIAVLKEALSWRFQKHFLLERTVLNRYSNVLIIDTSEDEKSVRFASDLVQHYFFQMQDEREQLQRHVAHQTEMRLVQQIIKTHLKSVFGNDEVYDRTELEAFFRSRQHTVARRIQLEDSECHTRILEICSVALCERESNSRLSAIREYAKSRFDIHVVNSDPMLVGVDTRKDISLRLLRLFRDPILVERWWADDNIDFLRYWIEEPYPCEQILRWLSTPEVEKHIRETQASEANEFVTRASSNPRQALLHTIANSFLAQWRRQLGKFLHMPFLRAYARLVSGNAQNVDLDLLTILSQSLGGFVSRTNYDEPFSVRDLEGFEQWAAPEKDTAEWQLCMANCLLDFDFWAEASERCQRGLELDSENVKLAFVHGKALLYDEKYNTAIEKFEYVKAAADKLLQEGDEIDKEAYWNDILMELGKCQAHLGRFEDASDTFSSIFEHAVDEDIFLDAGRDAVFFLTATLNAQDKHEEIISLLRRLSDRKLKSENDKTWLTSIFIDNEGALLATPFSKQALGFHSTILCAVRALNCLNTVESYYISTQSWLADQKRTSTTALENSSEQAGRFLVKYFHYKLICYAGPESRRSEALEGWEKDLIELELPILCYDNDDCLSFLRNSAEHVARTLLNEAKKSVHDRLIEGNLEIRLKKLTHLDPMISRFETFFDLRSILARLYFTTNRKTTARHTLLPMVRSSLCTIVEGDASIENISMCFLAIGHASTILEDDTNARLAFIFAAERAAALIKLEKVKADQIDRRSSSTTMQDVTTTISDQSAAPSTGKTDSSRGAGKTDEERATGKTEHELLREKAVQQKLQQAYLNGNVLDFNRNSSVGDDAVTPRGNSVTSIGPLEVSIPESAHSAAADGVFLTASTPGSGRPRYYRVHQDYLSTDTLRHYHVDYEIDQRDVNYIIIKQQLTGLEKELMFEHTTRLRKPRIEYWNNDMQSDKDKLRSIIQMLRNEELFTIPRIPCSNCNRAPPDIKMEYWVCRDCLGVDLCSECVIERRPETCPSDHTHVRVTLRDVQDVRSVNGERAPHTEKWVNQIRQDWNLDKPGPRTFSDLLMLILGVMAAKRFWKQRKYGRRGSQYTSSLPIPLKDLITREDIVGFKGSGDPAYLKEINGVTPTSPHKTEMSPQ